MQIVDDSETGVSGYDTAIDETEYKRMYAQKTDYLRGRFVQSLVMPTTGMLRIISTSRYIYICKKLPYHNTW